MKVTKWQEASIAHVQICQYPVIYRPVDFVGPMIYQRQVCRWTAGNTNLPKPVVLYNKFLVDNSNSGLAPIRILERLSAFQSAQNEHEMIMKLHIDHCFNLFKCSEASLMYEGGWIVDNDSVTVNCLPIMSWLADEKTESLKLCFSTFINITQVSFICPLALARRLQCVVQAPMD